MGKSNDAPPPPDYTPIAEASKASAEYSYRIADRQQKWAEKTYKENKKITDKFTDFIMGQMTKQAGWADEDRARYENVFQPLEDALVADAESYASPERQEYEAGKAEAKVAQEFEAARRTAQEKLETYGIDPTQTRAGAMDLQSRLAEAATQAGAGTMARERAEAVGRELREKAINVGRGYPAQVASSTAGAQGAGQAAVNSNLQTTASGASTMGTGGSWQGLGNQSIGQWGNTLNMGFTNALDAWKAEQSASSGIGGILGTVAGMGMKMIPGLAEGGVIPEFAEGGMPTGGDVSTPGGGAVPASMSPSAGVAVDDVAAVVDGAGPAKLSAGEFVIPEDVMSWKGEEWAQKEIMKARKQMQGGGGERPAQPTMGPPGMPQPGMPQPGVIPVQ